MTLLILKLVLFKKLFFSKDELRSLNDSRKFMAEETGYQHIQATKPQTLVFHISWNHLTPPPPKQKQKILIG